MPAYPRFVLLGALLLWASLVVRPVDARTRTESPYGKAQTYNGALRYLRVNLGYEVTERDPEAAYLLFRYLAPGQREPTAGSIEVVETEDRVMLLVEIPTLPTYHETVLKDGLLAKLRAEYGEPPRRRAKGGGRDGDRPKKDEDDSSGSGSKREAAPARGTRGAAGKGSERGSGS